MSRRETLLLKEIIELRTAGDELAKQVYYLSHHKTVAPSFKTTLGGLVRSWDSVQKNSVTK